MLHSHPKASVTWPTQHFPRNQSTVHVLAENIGHPWGHRACKQQESAYSKPGPRSCVCSCRQPFTEQVVFSTVNANQRCGHHPQVKPQSPGHEPVSSYSWGLPPRRCLPLPLPFGRKTSPGGISPLQQMPCPILLPAIVFLFVCFFNLPPAIYNSH